MGGAQQRLDARLLPDQVQSHTATRLLVLFAWGDLTPNKLQWISEGMKLDGLNHPDVDALAGIGASGQHKQNARRDLLRQFSKDVGQPLPLAISAPMRDKGDAVFEGTVSVLSPIHMADFMYKKKAAQFTEAGATHRDVGPSGTK